MWQDAGRIRHETWCTGLYSLHNLVEAYSILALFLKEMKEENQEEIWIQTIKTKSIHPKILKIQKWGKSLICYVEYLFAFRRFSVVHLMRNRLWCSQLLSARKLDLFARSLCRFAIYLFFFWYLMLYILVIYFHISFLLYFIFWFDIKFSSLISKIKFSSVNFIALKVT